ncbi:MAG TPA: class I SAM-dependent methyltransferase, partial [Methanosarcina vacuolata]|nr:class I SAM-dependent methyltransferase [Methanosarcina vacuolata]
VRWRLIPKWLVEKASITRNELFQYKKQFQNAIKVVLSKSNLGSLDEAAFPAYTHKNWIINNLFWNRLYAAMNLLEVKNEAVGLDFGCGSGVMLPFLSSISSQVIGADIDSIPISLIKEELELPDNIMFLLIENPLLPEIPERSLDYITALDVLEHVPDIDQTIDVLRNKFKIDG